ncbi:MAG: CBS domain-containing protein [Pseudohongiellaceae bacterium]
MNVNEIMSTNVKTCNVDTSLDEAARMMWDHDCGAIPVVNSKNKPIGIITDRDIAMAAMHRHLPLWDMSAGELIKGQHPVCSHQEDPLASCLQKMEQNGVRRILVTNQNGSLAGIISMGDILAFTSSRQNAAKSVGFGQVLSMLQHVSGHHAPTAGALAAQ